MNIAQRDQWRRLYANTGVSHTANTGPSLETSTVFTELRLPYLSAIESARTTSRWANRVQGGSEET